MESFLHSPKWIPSHTWHNDMWYPSSSTYLTTFVTSNGIINKAFYTHYPCVKVFHAQMLWRLFVKLDAKQRSYYAGSGLILPPHGTGPAPVLGGKGAMALLARLFPLNNTTTTGAPQFAFIRNIPRHTSFFNLWFSTWLVLITSQYMCYCHAY